MKIEYHQHTDPDGRDETSQDDIDLVVYSAAIKEDNPEYAQAVKRNLPLKVIIFRISSSSIIVLDDI